VLTLVLILILAVAFADLFGILAVAFEDLFGRYRDALMVVQDAAARGLFAQDGVAGQFGPIVTDEYLRLATPG
jgi:hypothetical protein